MTSYIPTEKGQTIRQPATANLMIDSEDRNKTNYPSSGNFQITKNASILNGFFTRIATTEVVLDWSEPNIVLNLNDSFDITIGLTTETITLPQGFYTVATALDKIVDEANSAFPGFIFSIVQDGAEVVLDCKTDPGAAAQDFTFESEATLLLQLGFKLYIPSNQKLVGEEGYPDLRPYKYLDIVSNQLTYVQDLKDSSTATEIRDVLCRWYFAWDTQPNLDAYGFAVFQGYTAFQERRLFNPPKQIRWEPNLPIGNLGFQVYGKYSVALSGSELLSTVNFEFLMTLQVSES